jgi:protein-L-isoaspartate(D-aspartate) O-methyltransferase
MSWDDERAALVGALMRRGILRTPRVIDAFLAVPRHLFLPEPIRGEAYVDSPQPIGSGQTISAPHMVAIMTELLDVKAHSRVLEVGTGSGYQAAIISHLAPKGFIVSVERHEALAAHAAGLLRRLGYVNVDVVVGDGTIGHPAGAPYERIIVTAAAPRVPKALIEQLGCGGRMLIPVGGRWSQTLLEVVKDGAGNVSESRRGGCVFVPLIGGDGW